MAGAPAAGGGGAKRGAASERALSSAFIALFACRAPSRARLRPLSPCLPGCARVLGADRGPRTGGGFESMGLSQQVYKAIIRKGYRVPTPIQRKVIDLVKGGRDVVAMARTGSGKTAAFLVPMLEQLQEHSPKVGARGIILTPTRELAMQTLKFARELGCFTNLRVCLLIGGESLDDQFAALAANPDIIVATPGRLMHHLAQTDMTLSQVQLCVFDEADRLFEMGFADQIKEIMKGMPEEKQTCLFSATLPQILADFTSAGLHDPYVHLLPP
jgi:ATP-dependent RNA helicase DDX54/DBP10